MAWTHRQGKFNTASGTTATVTLASAPLTGSTMCVGIMFYDSTSVVPTLTVKDSNNNVYTVSPNSPAAVRATEAGIVYTAYLLSAPANATATITATFSKSASLSTIRAEEFSSGATVTFDKDAAGSDYGTQINLPSITPTSAGELLYSYAGPSNTITGVVSPWTQDAAGVDSYGTLGEYILSSTSSATPVGFAVSGDSWDAMAMAFSASSGTGAVVTPAGVSSTFAINAPAATTTATPTVTGVGIVSAVGTPTVSTVSSVTATPAGVSIASAVHGLTSVVSTTAYVSSVSTTAAVHSLSTLAIATGTPSGVGSTTTVHSVATATVATVAVAGVGLSSTTGTPSAMSSVVTSPVGVAASSAVSSPAASSLVLAAAFGVNAVFVVGTPTAYAQSNAVVYVSGVHATFAVGTPAVSVTRATSGLVATNAMSVRSIAATNLFSVGGIFAQNAMAVHSVTARSDA